MVAGTPAGWAVRAWPLVALMLPAPVQAFDLSVTLVEPSRCELNPQCRADRCQGLNLDQTGRAQPVLDVTFRCNQPGGFAIGLTSANGGRLVHTRTRDAVIDYMLEFTIPTGAPADGFVQVGETAAILLVSPKAVFEPVDAELAIKLEQKAPLSGRYTDLLELWIAAQ